MAASDCRTVPTVHNHDDDDDDEEYCASLLQSFVSSKVLMV